MMGDASESDKAGMAEFREKVRDAILPLEEFYRPGDKRIIILAPPEGARTDRSDSYEIKKWKDSRCEIVSPYEFAGVRASEEVARQDCLRHYQERVLASLDLEALAAALKGSPDAG